MNYSEDFEISDVTEERDAGSVFDEFGIEPDYVEEQNGGIEIPDDFKVTELKDTYDGDYLQGKPYLSDVIEYEYEDKKTGEKKKSTYCELVLIDSDEKEAYKIRINLKSTDNIQKSVHKSSKLYALVVGLINLKNKGAFKNYNHLKKVNLDNIKNIVSKIDDLTVKVKEVQGKEFPYNTFVIVDGE